jgi:hypothetical protein
MMAKQDLNYSVLIESNEDKIDYYYKKLKTHGWFDFVDDFVTPEHNEDGVRIDNELNYPRTIKVDKITCENTLSLLGQIKFFVDV